MEQKLSLVGKESSMNVWYDWIKDYTPNSLFLHLSEEDYILFRAIQYDKLLEIDPYMGEMHDRPSTGLTKEGELIRLKEIEKELDIMFDNSYKFFRTDIFSPKDVGSCVVNTGKDVIRLMANSSRLYYYMPKVKVGKGISLILRDVVNYVEEYRVFINNEKVVGISQYLDSDIISYKLILEDDEYKNINDDKIKLVLNYVHKIIGKCGLKDVVLDVGIDINNNYNVVEINPYGDTTDKCLLKGKSFAENTLLVAYNIDKNNILIKFYEGEELSEEIIELKYLDKYEYDIKNPPTFSFKWVD